MNKIRVVLKNLMGEYKVREIQLPVIHTLTKQYCPQILINLCQPMDY